MKEQVAEGTWRAAECTPHRLLLGNKASRCIRFLARKHWLGFVRQGWEGVFVIFYDFEPLLVCCFVVFEQFHGETGGVEHLDHLLLAHIQMT